MLSRLKYNWMLKKSNIFDQIIIGIDMCNFTLQLMTTINKVWHKISRFCAGSAILMQTRSIGEYKSVIPSPLPVYSFFGDAFWPNTFASHPINCLHRINYSVFASARKSMWHLPPMQIQEGGDWRQEK